MPDLIAAIDWLQKWVVPLLGGAGGGALLVRFGGSRLVGHALDRQMARYRSELDARTEELKSQLSIRAHEQNLALTRIDEQRSEAVRMLYGHLLSWTRGIAEIVRGVEDQPDTSGALSATVNLIVSTRNAARSLLTGLEAHAIDFDPATFERLEASVVDVERRSDRQFQGLLTLEPPAWRPTSSCGLSSTSVTN